MQITVAKQQRKLYLSLSLLLSKIYITTMSLDVQKARLRCFITQMHDEGIVNDQFFQLQALKDATKPDYAVRAITMYCISAQSLFTNLSLHMEQHEVNYCQVNFFAQELYARSISIGAEHVKRACMSIIQACEKKNKQECNQALYLTKNEYCNLRRRFETLVQVVVNNQFTLIQASKSTEERRTFVQMIDIYCVDVEAIILDLRNCIDLPEVAFCSLAAKAHNIEEKSSSVGAEQVRAACKDFIHACDKKNKENVSRALTWLKNEFAKTKNKFKTIAQMERRIIRLEQKEGLSTRILSDPHGGIRKLLPM